MIRRPPRPEPVPDPIAPVRAAASFLRLVERLQRTAEMVVRL